MVCARAASFGQLPRCLVHESLQLRHAGADLRLVERRALAAGTRGGPVLEADAMVLLELIDETGEAIDHG